MKRNTLRKKLGQVVTMFVFLTIFSSLIIPEATAREITARVNIHADKVNFDRDTAKFVRIWFIYGTYNVSYTPKKICYFVRKISPPIPKTVSIDVPAASVPFTYDNRLVIGFYDLPNKNILYSNWAAIEQGSHEAFHRGVSHVLSFVFPQRRDYSIELDPSRAGTIGFEKGDFFVGFAEEYPGRSGQCFTP